MKGKHNVGKRKGELKYTTSMQKCKGGSLRRLSLKKKYLKKAKDQEHAFFDSLSDLNIDLGDNNSSSYSSDNESKRNAKVKPIGLYFHANTISMENGRPFAAGRWRGHVVGRRGGSPVHTRAGRGSGRGAV
jgi:hypothetical protein